MDIFGRGCKPDIGEHRPEFLRKAGEIKDARTASLQMCGHGDERADGDHAGSAHAGDHQVEGCVERRKLGIGEVGGKPRQVDLHA